MMTNYMENRLGGLERYIILLKIDQLKTTDKTSKCYEAGPMTPSIVLQRP